MNRDFNSFKIHANTVEKGKQEYECNPENTVLYLHDPERFDEYDHFFRRLMGDELPEEYQDSERNMGGFITRHVLGEFDEIAEAVCNSYNFQVVYRPEPISTDRMAIDEQMEALLHQELEDLDPNDFA